MTLRRDDVLDEFVSVPIVAPEILALWTSPPGGPTRDPVLRTVESASQGIREVLMRFAFAMSDGAAVSSVAHAVGCLGADHTRDVLLTLALRPGAGTVRWRTRTRVCWARAVATGTWARIISVYRNDKRPGAFLCGLLHDVGRLVVASRIARGQVIPDEVARRVGLAVVQAWGLPADVAVSVSHHRRYLRAPVYRQRVATVELARRLVSEDPRPTTDPVASFLELSSADLDAIHTHSHLVARAVAILA